MDSEVLLLEWFPKAVLHHPLPIDAVIFQRVLLDQEAESFQVEGERMAAVFLDLPPQLLVHFGALQVEIEQLLEMVLYLDHHHAHVDSVSRDDDVQTFHVGDHGFENLD